jgi:hypothetical protein
MIGCEGTCVRQMGRGLIAFVAGKSLAWVFHSLLRMVMRPGTPMTLSTAMGFCGSTTASERDAEAE